MGDRYIWGVQLLVEDVPGAKRWLCENLFFVEEEHKGMICLRNGNFRLVLREDKEHLADKYGPEVRTGVPRARGGRGAPHSRQAKALLKNGAASGSNASPAGCCGVKACVIALWLSAVRGW